MRSGCHRWPAALAASFCVFRCAFCAMATPLVLCAADCGNDAAYSPRRQTAPRASRLHACKARVLGMARSYSSMHVMCISSCRPVCDATHMVAVQAQLQICLPDVVRRRATCMHMPHVCLWCFTSRIELEITSLHGFVKYHQRR